MSQNTKSNSIIKIFTHKHYVSVMLNNYEFVLEKVNARLSRWKDRCLTMAGRICLIKSVLSSIMLFFMSLLKLSSGAAEKLVRI